MAATASAAHPTVAAAKVLMARASVALRSNAVVAAASAARRTVAAVRAPAARASVALRSSVVVAAASVARHTTARAISLMKLLLPPNVQRLTEGDRVVFFNPDVPSWVVTDSNGATVLSLCDGTMTLEETARLIEEEMGPS